MFTIHIEDSDEHTLNWSLDLADSYASFMADSVMTTAAEREEGQVRMAVLNRIIQAVLRASQIRNTAEGHGPSVPKLEIIKTRESMGGKYRLHMPAIFPWVAVVPKQNLIAYVLKIFDMPSSFAVTADGPHVDVVFLWLSDTSKITLEDQGLANSGKVE